jgi:hypothetical protein
MQAHRSGGSRIESFSTDLQVNSTASIDAVDRRIAVQEKPFFTPTVLPERHSSTAEATKRL